MKRLLAQAQNEVVGVKASVIVTDEVERERGITVRNNPIFMTTHVGYCVRLALGIKEADKWPHEKK